MLSLSPLAAPHALALTDPFLGLGLPPSSVFSESLTKRRAGCGRGGVVCCVGVVCGVGMGCVVWMQGQETGGETDGSTEADRAAAGLL